jgi:TP901 family phage tail tape measure protein
MAQSLGEAVFDLKLNDQAFQAGLRQADQSVKGFTDSTGRLRDEFGRFIPKQQLAAQGLADFAGTAGKSQVFRALGDEIKNIALQLGLVATAAKAFQQLAQADEASAALRTLGVDTVELGSNLRVVSAELKANTSTLQLSKAAYDVASAGFAKAADATAILKASAQGAKGGFSDLNTVADATTSVLNAYGLSAENATKIVDGFITTQNDGKIVVGQYADQIGRVAPIAAAAGVGIDELNAAISAATAQGVPVESTFAGLRQAISSILKPSKEASDLAESLGLRFNAQALQAKGLGAFLQDVAVKTKGNAAQNNVLFGSIEALAAVQPLLNDQLQKYNQFLDNQRNSAGAAAEAANISSQTISSGIAAIGNAFSNLVTSSNLSGIGDAFVEIAETINSISLTPAEQQLAGITTAIERVTAEIQRQKEYGLDTTAAENRLKQLEQRANVVRQAIGEQTRIEQLKGEAAAIQKQAEELQKAGVNAEALKSELIALGLEISAIEGRDTSFQLPGLGLLANTVSTKVIPEIKKFNNELKNSEKQLAQLELEKKLKPPGIDTTQLDGDIAKVKANIESLQARIKITAQSQAVDSEINRIKSQLNDPRLSLSLVGPQTRKDLTDTLSSLQAQKQILQQIGAQGAQNNQKQVQASQQADAQAQKQAQNVVLLAKQQAAAAEQKQLALQAEVQQQEQLLGQQATRLNLEANSLKANEQRLGLYAQEFNLVGQIDKARNDAALNRSNTAKTLLDQELQQAQVLAGSDEERAKLQQLYGKAKLDQTLREFDIKKNGLASELASQEASLEFEKLKAEAASRRAIIEAQIGVIKAQQAVVKGDPAADQELQLAKQLLDLSQQSYNDEQRLGDLRTQLFKDQKQAAIERLENERLVALSGLKAFGTEQQRAQIQRDVNDFIKDQARNTGIASVAAGNFKRELQNSVKARGELSDAFEAQVKTVLDGSGQFAQMNSLLSSIALNTSKPPTVNVTVNNSGGGCGGNSSASVKASGRS